MQARQRTLNYNYIWFESRSESSRHCNFTIKQLAEWFPWHATGTKMLKTDMVAKSLQAAPFQSLMAMPWDGTMSESPCGWPDLQLEAHQVCEDRKSWTCAQTKPQCPSLPSTLWRVRPRSSSPVSHLRVLLIKSVWLSREDTSPCALRYPLLEAAHLSGLQWQQVSHNLAPVTTPQSQVVRRFPLCNTKPRPSWDSALGTDNVITSTDSHVLNLRLLICCIGSKWACICKTLVSLPEITLIRKCPCISSIMDTMQTRASTSR